MKINNISHVGILYILIIGGINHLFDIPEIYAAFLALPGFIIIPFLLGTFILALLNLNKSHYIIDGSLLSFTCKWLIGLIFLTIYAMFLDGFGIFNIYIYIISILLIALGGGFSKHSQLNIDKITILDVVVVFLIFLSGFASLAIKLAPFPLLLELDHFRINVEIIKIFGENIISYEYPYLPWLPLLMVILTLIFNVDSFSLFWTGQFLSHIIFPASIYLFTYQISKNKSISLISAVLSPWFVWSKTIALHRFIPQTALYILFPIILAGVYNFSEKYKIHRNQDGRRVFLVVLFILTILTIYISQTFSISLPTLQHQPIYRISSLALFVGISFAMIKYSLKNTNYLNVSIFILISFSALLVIHTIMAPVAAVLISFFVFFTMYMKKHFNQSRYIIFFALLIIVLLLYTNSFEKTFLMPDILNNPSYDYWSITPSMKQTIIVSSYTLPVLFLFFLGSVLMLMESNPYMLLVAVFVLLTFIYFPNPPILVRNLLFFTPFIASITAIIVHKIYNYPRRNNSNILFICIIIALLITSLTLPGLRMMNSIQYTGQLNNEDYISFYNQEELKGGYWLKDNLKDDFIIVSDPTSQLIFHGLSSGQHIGETSSITPYGETILRQIITVNSSNESYELINWIMVQNLSEDYIETTKSFFKKRILDRYKANKYSINLENKKVILIITPRTIKYAREEMDWSRFREDVNLNPPTVIQVPGIKDGKPHLNKFYNSEYFIPLYSIENKLYIFGVNPEPGKPFEI